MIAFQDVSKSFGKKQVLDSISFEVARGEILFILGKSGMGKSVTLKHIVGLLKPDRGEVRVNGRNVTQATAVELSAIRRDCGMVFQHPALLDSLTILENVAFGLKTPQFVLSQPDQRPLPEGEIRSRVLETLSHVNLGEDLLNRMPTELSYGMQKRVSLARTLAPMPSVLLFDEPTTGLDPITTNAVNDLIFDLSRKLQVTSIVVSHDMQCALKIADRILVLDQAKILAVGPVDSILKSEELLVREFLEETLALLPPDQRNAAAWKLRRSTHA